MGIGRFVNCRNHHRGHESLGNPSPADAGHGRGREIVKARGLVKEQTMRRGRRHNLGLGPYEEIINSELYRECDYWQWANPVSKTLTTDMLKLNLTIRWDTI